MEELIFRISRPRLRVRSRLSHRDHSCFRLFLLLVVGWLASKYTLPSYIPDVAGFGLHSPVRLDGLRVGSVTAIRPAQHRGAYEVDIHRGSQRNAIGANGEIRFVPTQEITAKDVVDSLRKAPDCSQAEKSSMLQTRRCRLLLNHPPNMLVLLARHATCHHP